MGSARGKPLCAEEKRLIVTLKEYFDRNKTAFGLNERSVQLVAEALNIGVATVSRIIADYNKNPDSVNSKKQTFRGRPTYSIDASSQEIIRSFIRAANLEGTHVTLETINDFLQEKNAEETFHITTLARTLDRWGFEFGKGTRTQHLKEKDYVIASRHRYLRKIRNNRIENSYEKTLRPEVYLDESYVNKNHSNDYVWYFREDGPWIQKPTGNGDRFIIVNAITKNGWVTNAQLVFKSSRKTGDYHGQMNFEIFRKWFSEKLLPNISKNSIIVMDNAPYHNVLSINSPPIATSSKTKIFDWLEKNKFPCNPDCLKAELVEALNKIGAEPIYAIDEIASQQGHEVIRTPPYHPELQPIEICWGVLKNEIARNCNFTMKNLEIQLENAFKKVTQETCGKIIKKIKKIEDEFWDNDSAIEEKHMDDALFEQI